MRTKAERAREYNRELQTALRMLWEATNPGQQRQALKIPVLKAALVRFGIVGEGADEPDE